MSLKPSHLLLSLARRLWRATLRLLLTGAICAACLLAATYYLGIPLPGARELLEKFEGAARLAEILS
jgi:hypothetical protein